MAKSFCEDRFCLGLGPDWLECCRNYHKEDKSGADSKRFKTFITDDELADLSKGFVPKNTSNSNGWALRNFQAWAEARNSRLPNDMVPPDLLQTTVTSLF